MASRFWVGGTGTWDASDTTHWAASSGGAGGQSVPGSADTVTFDGASGGGTVTLNFGGTITITSLTMGAFTGTWDNSANNNNITCTITTSNALDISGTGTRTINLGSATYTISSTFTSATVTNLTLSAASATIVMNTAATLKTFAGGGRTYGTLTINAQSGAGYVIITGANTFSTINVNPTAKLEFTAGTTNTVTTMNLNGTSSNQILLSSDSGVTQATIAVTTMTATYAAFRSLAFTGSPSATNSFNLGNNTGITITAPGGGGGSSAHVIG